MKITTEYNDDVVDIANKADQDDDLRIEVSDSYSGDSVTLWLNRSERTELRDHLATVDGVAVSLSDATPPLERIAAAIEALRDTKTGPVATVDYDEPKKADPDLHGFTVGERVVLVGPNNGGGLYGVVEPGAYECASRDSIPVRLDDGNGDGFPAAWTLPVEALSHVPEPPKFGLGKPHGHEEEWNKAAVEQAIERELTVRFTYVKPAARYRPVWEGDRSQRRVVPERIEQFGTYYIIKGYDIDADGDRAFRTDRIEGYVTVE